MLCTGGPPTYTVFTVRTIVLFTIVFFGKKTHETFHILKMKTHFEKEPHFENESSFSNSSISKVAMVKNAFLIMSL